MINKCKICGREFNARQSNYTLCSDECRKENKRENSKRAWQEIKADPYLLQRRRLQEREHSRAKYSKSHKKCIQCGGDTGSYYAKYCIDCLLNNYFDNPNAVNLNRLHNRGFDKELITEEAEIRGVAMPETKTGPKRK